MDTKSFQSKRKLKECKDLPKNMKDGANSLRCAKSVVWRLIQATDGIARCRTAGGYEMKSKEDVFLEVLQLYELAMRTINRLVYDGDDEAHVLECVNKNLESAIKYMIYEYKEAES